jgi:hypothetical protein
VYGIEAINAHNGWAMAIAGALIVVSGLSVLSFIISQLHKILALTDKLKKSEDIDQPSVPKSVPATTVDHDLSNLEGSLTCYCDESATLGSAFTLQDLFTVFQQCDFPHPHLTIRSLKEEGFLIPADPGKFSWKK